jgi:hypothetical protein
MARTGHGYRLRMGTQDLVTFLGERHLDRSEIPSALQAYIDDALRHGLVMEDCRDKLTAGLLAGVSAGTPPGTPTP